MYDKRKGYKISDGLRLKGGGEAVAAYFFTTIGQVATLFIMMAVGYILAKMDKLGEKTLSQISFLIMSVVCPSVIIDIMQMEKTPETLDFSTFPTISAPCGRWGEADKEKGPA